MDHINYFDDMYESIPDFGNVALLKFLFNIDVDMLHESGFSKNDFDCLSKDFKTILFEQIKTYLE